MIGARSTAILGRIFFLAVATAALSACAGCASEPETAAVEAAPIAVRVAPVRRGAISEVVIASGETAALSSMRLASPVAGRLTFLEVQVGDRLDSGALVARLMPLESEAAINGFGVLEGAGALGPGERRLAQRMRRNLRAGEISLRAPFAAVVAARLHSPGELVAPQDVLVELFDPHSLYALAQVPATVARRLRPGLPVEVMDEGVRLEGAVSAVLPAVEPQSLTVPVRIALRQIPQPPLLHAAVRCRITLETHADALLMPRAALVSSTTGPEGTVMVAAGGKAVRRRVRLGLRREDAIEVIAGLAAGDQVLVAGQYSLPDGSAIVPQPAAGAEADPPS